MNNTVYMHIHKCVECIHLHAYVCLHLKSVPDIFKKWLLCVHMHACVWVSGYVESCSTSQIPGHPVSRVLTF
jgi:hypothetical protein